MEQHNQYSASAKTYRLANMYIYFFFLAHLDWNRHRRVHFFSVRLLIVNFSIPVECDWSGGRCFVELLLPPSINTWICPLSHISHTIYRIYIFVNYNNNKWEPGTVMNRCSPFTWHKSLRFTERREKKIESKQLKMKSDQKFVFFFLLFHRLDFIFHLARVYVCRIRACQSSLLRLQRRSMHAFNHSRNPLRNRMSTNNARAIERDCYAKKKCVFKIISHFVIF